MRSITNVSMDPTRPTHPIPLGAEELHALLDREFRRRRPRDCDVCYVALPYRVNTRGTSASNWEVTLPVPCDHGCDQVMDEIVYELAPRFVLREVDDR